MGISYRHQEPCWRQSGKDINEDKIAQMIGQSEQEIAKVIEDEIAGSRDPQERYDRLLKHAGELADRWIGFATMRNISAKARIANDGFRALQVSLRMSLDSSRHVEASAKLRFNLETLIAKTSALTQSCNDSAIEELIDLLKETLLLDLSGH